MASMPPPPPRFPAAAAAPEDRSADVKAAAVAAASAAAANVAPGQRDRAIAEATRAVLAQHEDAKAYKAKQAAAAAEAAAAAAAAGAEAGGTAAADGTAGSSGPGAGTGAAGPVSTSYTPPPWAGVPEGISYSLEMLREGSVLAVQDVSAKDHYTFGRIPECDFVLEHPSASRVHAVLQYNGGTKEAFLFDCGSTHGTFVNKARIKAGVHVPLPVGSTFKLGQSTRIYVFNGPQELMPEEGLSRQQKKQLADMEYAKKMAAKEKEVARAQMQAVIAGDMNWGMREDASSMDPDDLSSIDWRVYQASGHVLNDRQQKLAEKVRAREYKTANLRKEVEKIQAKEKGEGGLTAGQASTVVRNEQVIEKLADEIEELEEQLNESVRQALKDKLRDKEAREEAAGEGGGKKRRKGGLDEEDERYLEASDSEDEMYDRTAAQRGKDGAAADRKGGKGAGKAGKKGDKGPVVVESAEGLYGKREVLMEEKTRLEKAIAEEEEALAARGAAAAAAGAAGAGAAAGGESQEPAAGQLAPPAEEQQAASGVATVGAGAEGAVAAGETTASAATAAAVAPMAEGAAGDAAADSLDAFMDTMQTHMDVDKLKALRKELADVEAQLERTARLLKIADPDGWLRPGTKAAAAAKANAAKVIEAERQRRAAAAAAAAKKLDQEASASFVEEFEEDEGTAAPTASTQQQQQQQQPGSSGQAAPGGAQASGTQASAEAGGLQLRIRPKGPAVAAGAGGKAPGAAAGKHGKPVNPQAAAAAAQLIREFSTSAAAGAAAGHFPDAEQQPKSPTGTKSHKRRADELASELAADARVAADMALLAAATQRRAELEDEGSGGPPGPGAGAAGKKKARGTGQAADTWVPPTDQTGDGRTSLNEKLGY